MSTTLTQNVRTIRTTNPGYYTYRCIVTENSTNIANNASNVTITFSIIGPSGWGECFYDHTISYGIIVDGVEKKSGSSAPYVTSNSYVQLLTWTGDIEHNADGAKSIVVKVYLSHNSSGYTYMPLASTSSSPLSMGSVTLTTIARASQPSCITYPNTTSNIGDIGSTIYIHMNRASSSFTHTVRYAWGNLSGTIGTNVESNIQWTIPTSFYSQIPSDTSGVGTIYVDTYNGGSFIGTKSVRFTATVSSSIVPTVGTLTLDPVDINSKNILVQNKNKIAVSVSGCSAGTGSSIKSYKFEGPGISSTTTSTSVSGGPISSTGTLTYKVTVTDNRGRTASKSATITCYAYDTPSFTSFKAYRANSNGSANLNGTYLRYEYTINYSSVNSTNAVSVKIYGAGNAVTHSASSGSGTINLGNDTTTYNMYAVVTDSYGGSKQSSTITVFGSTRIMNVTKDGTGVAFGKMAESNNLFECRWNAKFDGTASGPSGFSTSSDARVKKNIQDINIDIIDSLHPVSYELLQSSDDKTHYGFIAQDINEVLSDAGLSPDSIGLVGQIFNNGRQEYVLTYTEFIPLLTKKCQDLQAEINILKEEISALKNASQ